MIFVNRDSEFPNWTERLYAELEMESRRGSFTVLADRIMIFKDYVQLFVQQQSRQNQRVILKIDLVNDVAPHYGSIEWDDTLGRVDSWRNILSNKVSALYRVEAKDVIDLWTLARLKNPVNCKKIIMNQCPLLGNYNDTWKANICSKCLRFLQGGDHAYKIR